MICVLTYIGITVVASVIVVRIMYPPIWLDLLSLKIVFSFLKNVIKALKKKEFIIDQFEKQAKLQPDKTMILYKDESFSYREVNRKACQVAEVLLALGLMRGDTVALVMSNEPAYLWMYLGVQKIGVRISLINHHLLSDGLVRSINACSPKLIIVGDGLPEDYLPAKLFDKKSRFPPDSPIYAYNQPPGNIQLPCFRELMDAKPGNDVTTQYRRDVKITDPSSFIYTSGTTGLPKPAIITHKKTILCSMTYAPVGFSHKDIVYVALPLYHASAMNLAVLNVINQGATLAIRDKFSASNFWSDCIRYDVTLVQYIGELMRYLVNLPEGPQEKSHKVWAVAGNGLRRDVWAKVNQRFGFKHVFEFYGSTEIPATLTNYFNIEGSVGRLSPLLAKLNSLVLVDVDTHSQKHYRDETGRCRKTLPGGTGILMARLSHKVTFDGYLGPASLSESRLVKDVFQPGDVYVTTGDVFTIDQHYNVFYKDRLENSIRWKGENVSTMEVSNALIGSDFIQDANVYGVAIPGSEGKAGMAAISLKGECELEEDKVEEIARLSKDSLPGYARPRFLRFQHQMSLTSTFKQDKLDLAREGFDVTKIQDPIYYLDRTDDTYQRLDKETYRHILSGDQVI